ncbi:MAG: GIY-YIG nuclease family protein [Ignavibacteria bacterium]|nr:GIY-YIG nuclease family protein [Ignavibacteria bacterium]MCC7158274.1 GIY-YIG nuclease family protein [Ignavibacteria bacterium]
MHSYCVYILASKKDGVLYTGVTNCLVKRVYEHKNNLNKGFSERYFVKKLVYYEQYKYIDEAIAREKCIKRWKRAWKIRLIEENNPNWKDLFYDIGGEDYEFTMRFMKEQKRFLPSQE